MEMFAVMPRTTMVMLGGMMRPSTPEGPMMEAMKALEYFWRFISGTTTEPTAKVVATVEPDTAPKSVQVATEVMASPPGRRPTMTLARRIRRRVRPPSPMMLPASMNSGSASREKELAPANMRCTSTSREKPSKSIMPPDTAPMMKAMGRPRNRSAKKIIRAATIMRPSPPFHNWERPHPRGRAYPE